MGTRQHGPKRNPPPVGSETPGAAARVLSRVVECSTRVQRPAVRAYLERLRNASPGISPTETLAQLERRYLTTVTTSGAVVGSLAVLPGIGTLVAFSVIAVETAVFLEATAVFALAVAEVHDVPADHREQRRALVLAVLVGDGGRRAVTDLLGPGRTGGAWLAGGPAGTAALPLPALSELNSRLLRYFVRRYTLRRSALALGKLLPAGLGAVVGGVGNRMIGKKIIANARKAFGEPPGRWPVTLRLLPTMYEVDPQRDGPGAVG